MTTIIFLFLVFNIFSFSSQTIKAAIFCGGYLDSIYVVEGTRESVIATRSSEMPKGGRQTPYCFDELNAVPGDLIKIKCYNYNPSPGSGFFDKLTRSFGAGCFLLNDNCYCYDFDSDLPKDNDDFKDLTATFDIKSCSIRVFPLQERSSNMKNYYYQHEIPLDASKISCKNNINNALICLNGLDCNIKLSDYIIAYFDIKNVGCKITKNFNYFYLNSVNLVENKKFKITNELTFNSVNPTKFQIII